MDVPERYFEFGPHVGGRDAKAVRKTVSGLIKLIHPDGKVEQGEVLEYVEFAMEQRRRVKEQLKKMGGLEYWDVGFPYSDPETGAETYVGLPESRAGAMITGAAPAAWSAYTLGIDTVGSRQPQARPVPHPDAGEPWQWPDHPPRQPVDDDEGGAQDRRTPTSRATSRTWGSTATASQYDFSVQAVNLNQAKEGSETAIGFFVSLVSALLERPVDPTHGGRRRDERPGDAAEGRQPV